MRTFIRQSLLLASKDTKIFFRDRFAVVFAFAFPLLFTLGFTLALGGILSGDEPLEVTLTTQEEGEDSLSRKIIDGLAEAETFTVNEMAHETARREVEAGRLPGFIAFPSRFTESLAGVGGGNTAVLEVVTNADDPEDAAGTRRVGAYHRSTSVGYSIGIPFAELASGRSRPSGSHAATAGLLGLVIHATCELPRGAGGRHR